MLTKEQRDELRAKALAVADTGKWVRELAQDGEMLPDGTGWAGDYYETKDVFGIAEDGEVVEDVASCGSNAVASYLVAARPEVVLALLDSIDAAERGA